MVLLVIIITAFLVLRPYIQRGVYGMWGKSGQGFAFGRQYDPQKSVDCAFDEQANQWYDRNCFESLVGSATPLCNSGSPCEEQYRHNCSGSTTNSACAQINGAGPD